MADQKPKCPYQAKKLEEERLAKEKAAAEGGCPYHAKKFAESNNKSSNPNPLPLGTQIEDYKPSVSHEQAKKDAKEAYELVGKTGHIEGNLKKAKAVMNYLGYTDEEFAAVSNDAYNYQGVGCPFRFANLKKGETVLDLGSGLGIDSTIALHYVDETVSTDKPGKVVGLDLSESEVAHANSKMAKKNIPQNKVKFISGDMENMPKENHPNEFGDEVYDCVISNGAFCLAPSKVKAFSEIYRVLKPGGRMAVCTSVVKAELAQGEKWPLCMEMFINVNKIKPICEKIGFSNITIDDSNSLMQHDIPGFEEEEKRGKTEILDAGDENNQEMCSHARKALELKKQEEAEKRKKNGVHNDSEEFKHLKNYDMNQLTARVVVIAEKPRVKA